MGDMHTGSANCATDLVKKRVQEIADDDYGVWLGIGDYSEWIAPDDPRFHAGGLDTEIVTLTGLSMLRRTYLDYLTDLLWPIRDKCAALGQGNHEEKYDRRRDDDMTFGLAENLGIPDRYTGWAAITTLQFKDGNRHTDSFDIYHSHGHQAGRKGGALVNGLDDLMGWIEADIYFQGHSHQYIAKHKATIYKDGERIRQRIKVGWHTGSFLKTYEQGVVSYAERAGFPATVLGTPTVNIYPSREGHGYVE
jgi:hypothetical protein